MHSFYKDDLENMDHVSYDYMMLNSAYRGRT